MNKLKHWIFKTFFNKTIKVVAVKNYIFKFTKQYLEIKSVSDSISIRIGAGMHPYAFLLEASMQGLEKQLYGYAYLVFSSALLMTKDQDFVVAMNDALLAYSDQTLAKGAELATQVTEDQEKADAELMKGTIERAGMTRQQRRKAERDARDKMRKIYNEIKAEERKIENARKKK